MRRPRGYHRGDWLAACYQCGKTGLASTMRKHWKGYWVCPKHWEERHPQDFVRGMQDVQTPPWVQPPTDIYLYFCDVAGRSAWPGRAVPGCMIPGQTVYSYGE